MNFRWKFKNSPKNLSKPPKSYNNLTQKDADVDKFNVGIFTKIINFLVLFGFRFEFRRTFGINADEFAFVAFIFEFNDAFDQRK